MIRRPGLLRRPAGPAGSDRAASRRPPNVERASLLVPPGLL